MLEINNRIISSSSDPYVIAEISANHGGSLENAYKLINAAKASGADAVKLQTYTPDSMTLNCTKQDFLIKDGLWKGYNLYNLYKEACTPYEWHEKLFKYANELKITIFSSPFDAHAIDFLDELNVPAFKIASFEIVDLNLIKHAASKGKPLLISTGMASKDEIDNAVRIAKDYGNGELLLFHCVSSYPALTEDSNIKLIKTLRQKYNTEVGLSDHTLSNTASIAAISMGASAIEKHFILNKNCKGPDSAFSIDPEQFRELKNSTTQCWQALGKGDFHRSKNEQKNKIFRRSLYFVNNLKCGEIISKNDIKSIRPGFGLPPRYLDQIVNKKRVLKNVFVGDRVQWDILD